MTTPDVDSPAEIASAYRMFGAFSLTEEVSGEGFWRRAGARLLDLIILNLVEAIVMIALMIPILLAASIAGTPAATAAERLQRLTFSSFVLGLISALAYFTVFEWLYGATPGKRLTNLVVVSEELGPCTLSAALKRNVAWFLESLAWGIPAFIAIRNSPRAQRHGDRWASTIVPLRSNVPPSTLHPVSRFLLAAVVALAAVTVCMGFGLVLKL